MPDFKHILFIALLLFANLVQANTRSFDNNVSINNFINDMVKKHNFNADKLKKLFAQTHLHQNILDAIARPAESKPWREYRPIFLTRDRLKGGLKFWRENEASLRRAHAIFGVPEEIIVAIIGVETRYGKHAGRYPVIDALATLAFAYPPRSPFFRKELREYLLMSREEGLNPLQQKGSYAGAMGMPQFMPSSFRQYAIDFNGDGRRDLWRNPSDAIGSVANYFKKHHWKKGQPIANKVSVRGEAYKKLLGSNGRHLLKPHLSQQELRTHGIIMPKGLPANMQGSLIELDGKYGPEQWLVWPNFYVISRYNHSALYSMSVFQLSQKLRENR
ncbi:Membrane-bound lytic murein transglycosylase B [hydrothermal vent metagenome]|uniref:Membrane-bound lytic murein transglycosylase B n=1 Tax=hydrothermal vent metagenome TaxID=652676 RepID=A0A3B1B8W3_9ZZZZ